MPRLLRDVEGRQSNFSKVTDPRLNGAPLQNVHTPLRFPLSLQLDPPCEQIQKAVAGTAARDEDGEEEADSEASSVPSLMSDDSDVDDACEALLAVPKLGLQEEGRPKGLRLPYEDIAAIMMVTWIKMTPQQVDEEIMRMARLMVPVVRGPELVRLLQSQPNRPAKADPPQRGKHMGPCVSHAALVWIQAVMQAKKLLVLAAEALGTTYEAVEGDLICMKIAHDGYDGMWRLLQLALHKNPLLVLDYQALQLLFQATDEALQSESGPQVGATIIITSEQLINTMADLSGLPRERVAKRAAQPHGHAVMVALVEWFCKTTGYLDFDKETAGGCIRSDLEIPVGNNEPYLQEASICDRGQILRMVQTLGISIPADSQHVSRSKRSAISAATASKSIARGMLADESTDSASAATAGPSTGLSNEAKRGSLQFAAERDDDGLPKPSRDDNHVRCY